MKIKIILALLPMLIGCANPPECVNEIQDRFPNGRIFKHCSTLIIIDTVKKQVYITRSVCQGNNGLEYLGDY